MEFTDRLVRLGLTKAEFAEHLGVSKQAVGNYATRGLTPEAEALLEELEAGLESEPAEAGSLNGPDERVGVGELVETDFGLGRVVRRDRCESLGGRVSWIYHVCRAYQGKDGWTYEGPALRYPEKLIRRSKVSGVVWAERAVRGKVAD